MKLTQLFESDEQLRDMEAKAARGDHEALLRLANNYFRNKDPRLGTLIDLLRGVDDPMALELIRGWAKDNSIPTADEFVRNLTAAPSSVTFDKAETAAVEAGLKLVERDENGRSGYYYMVSIYHSLADDNYVWLVFGNEEGDYISNYGSISAEDLKAAKKDYDRRGDEWADWGMLDYFRDYLY